MATQSGAAMTSYSRQSQYVKSWIASYNKLNNLVLSVSGSSYTAPTALGKKLNKLGLWLTFLFNVFKRFFKFLPRFFAFLSFIFVERYFYISDFNHSIFKNISAVFTAQHGAINDSSAAPTTAENLLLAYVLIVSAHGAIHLL